MSQTTAPRAGARAEAPPETSNRRRGVVVGFSVALAAALVGGGTLAIRAGAATAPRPPAATASAVETLDLSARAGHDVRRAYAARVEAAREASLAFETGGTVVKILPEEGMRVIAGTVLARLDTRLLEAKRLQLLAAREALDSDAELARLALARQRELEANDFAPDAALDEARLATSRVASRIAEADAALTLVAVELDKAVLRAPFDAFVGARMLDPGATVSAGTPVMALLEAGPKRLRVGLPPERAAALDAGRAYTFTTGGEEISARLVSRRADVDARTRTVSAVFEPIDRGGADLFFGELAELALVERIDGKVFEVPLAALAEDERGLWSVMSVVPASANSDETSTPDDDERAELQRVAVEIVHVAGDVVWVSVDTEDGIRIVADGRHRVVDGEGVRVAAAGAERGS